MYKTETEPPQNFVSYTHAVVTGVTIAGHNVMIIWSTRLSTLLDELVLSNPLHHPRLYERPIPFV